MGGAIDFEHEREKRRWREAGARRKRGWRCGTKVKEQGLDAVLNRKEKKQIPRPPIARTRNDKLAEFLYRVEFGLCVYFPATGADPDGCSRWLRACAFRLS